ncbi:hypothetical protein E4Z66_18615 [Aliishimia ponticola]|uniref:2-dehydropantoate 2-reductase n=1 Tax=Aliishimia ponticola TaxID=2499833 RepID=A0A4S4N7D6_9RHOB|nr:2-dehydropantoate 2-reductase N-terminal domain-containing protein [Aliishimia ponticola]THH34445.1 hypothetical protein E4Z66_18615 [Aliishimia ponticola]
MSVPYKIGVIGAGNIGTAMAALLSRSGAEIHVTARGARLAQITQAGVELNDRGEIITARPKVCEAITEPMDALFVCVKSQSLASAIALNRAAIAPSTLVIPMVNGLPFWFYASADGMGHVPLLDPDRVLARTLSPAQVLGAVLLMTVQTDATGKATSSNTPTLSLGAVSDGTDEAAVTRLIALLETSGVRTDFDPAIRQKVLVKLLANFATNALSALTGAMLDDIGRDPALRSVATGLADEFRAWASREGYSLPPNAWLVDLLIDAGAFPTSMLQDALAGKPLELDAICRAPMDRARMGGGDMPIMGALLDRLAHAGHTPVPRSDIPAILRSLPLSPIPAQKTA